MPELSTKFAFVVLVSSTWLLVTSAVLGFLCIQFPPHELSPSWASALLGFHLAGAELRLFQPGYI